MHYRGTVLTSVLLGTDVPELMELLEADKDGCTQDVMAVMTMQSSSRVSVTRGCGTLCTEEGSRTAPHQQGESMSFSYHSGVSNNLCLAKCHGFRVTTACLSGVVQSPLTALLGQFEECMVTSLVTVEALHLL